MNDGARKLREWRDAESLSQMAAATMLGLHVSEVSRLERGHGVSLSRAMLLRDRIGIPMDAWLARTQEEPVEGS